MTVLAPGIGGSVGNATYQLARAQGAGKVISTAGSAAKAARARELGFEDVIDLTDGRPRRGRSPDNGRQGRRYRHREHRRHRDQRGVEQPCSRRCPDHVGLFRRTQNHDRCDGPDLEARADGGFSLFAQSPAAIATAWRDIIPLIVGGSVKPIVERVYPLRRGRRSLAPSDRGSAVWQSRDWAWSLIFRTPTRLRRGSHRRDRRHRALHVALRASDRSASASFSRWDIPPLCSALALLITVAAPASPAKFRNYRSLGGVIGAGGVGTLSVGHRDTQPAGAAGSAPAGLAQARPGEAQPRSPGGPCWRGGAWSTGSLADACAG
jgi:hypothetical protein